MWYPSSTTIKSAENPVQNGIFVMKKLFTADSFVFILLTEFIFSERSPLYRDLIDTGKLRLVLILFARKYPISITSVISPIFYLLCVRLVRSMGRGVVCGNVRLSVNRIMQYACRITVCENLYELSLKLKITLNITLTLNRPYRTQPHWLFRTLAAHSL